MNRLPSFIRTMAGSRSFHPSLEVHVPISPNRPMFNMAHALTLSLRRFGGAYADAPVIITVGDEDYKPELLARPPAWLARRNVRLRFVPKDLFSRYSIYGTAVYRFVQDFEADMVLMLDADVLVARPFDDLVRRMWLSRQFAGLIAHVSPFESSQYWDTVFRHAGLGTPRLSQEHTGWGTMDVDAGRRFCPHYFNLGVLLAQKDVMRRVGARMFACLDSVESLMEIFFRCQIALTLAIESQDIPCLCLPMRFNFPNDPLLGERYREELPRATFLHLLRDHEGVGKWRLFHDLTAIESFSTRTDLTRINLQAQAVLRAILPDMTRDQERLDERIFSAVAAPDV